LQRHKVPEDDARLVAVQEVVTKNQKRFNWTSGPQPGSDQGAEHEGDHETELESPDTEPGYEQVDESVSSMT
jgi:hypothetical protein